MKTLPSDSNSADLLAQQTTLLQALSAENTQDAIKYIALDAYSMPGRSHFCLKNQAFAERGLRAYRANAQEIAQRSFAVAYPILVQMLGEEAAQHLALDFWQAHPPKRGDLAQWGAEVAPWMTTHAPLQDLLAEHAFLPDVARMEWALHQAVTAPDVVQDQGSLASLAQLDPAALRLELHPACHWVASAYPIVDMAQWHQSPALWPASSESASPHIAVVWAQQWRPRIKAAGSGELALIQASLAGRSVVDALDAALQAESGFDFQTWLQNALEQGLLLSIQKI
jgi:hypothetical protein